MSNQLQIFKGSVGSGGGGGSGDLTVVLGSFKALNAGTGYSVDDLIFLQKVGSATPQWYNGTTNAIISVPNSTDLGSISSASSVSVTSSILPTGAATSAKQLADNHQVSVSNTVAVSDGGGSLTVDGTVTANTGLSQPLTNAELRLSAVPVSVASLPSHPVTNAGTFAVQATNQANSGVDIGDVTINNASGGGAVNIQDGGNSITVDGTVSATQNGTWDVRNISGTISLPTGAATDALQSAGNSTLSAINTKLPSQGQALAAASLPVVLTAAQISTLTPPASITGYATEAKQPALGIAGAASTDVITIQGIAGGTNLNIAGTVTANLSTTDRNTANSSDSSLSAINAKLVSGTDIGDVTINNASGAAAVNIQDGGNSITVDGNVGITGTAGTNLSSIDSKIPANLTVTSTRLLVDGSGVTQPISGTVTANTGLSQPLTDTQLRASPPTVSLSSSNITALTPPAAITGFATETTLTSILTALNGNVNFNESIWTDDTGAYFARRVTQNQDTNTITVTYTLPDGSAYTVGANPRPLAAVDRELRTTLYNCNTGGTGYTSGDDVIRTDIIDINTSSVIVTLWYNATAKTNIAAPTSGHLDYISTEGFSTAALQTALNNAVGTASDSAATTDAGTFSLLALIKRALQNWTTLQGKIPALGQTTKNLSIPVAIASNQDALAVTGTFWQATQPVSLSALPALATGSNVIGSISNTAFIANAGTNLNTSALALETGGNLASIKTNTDNLNLNQASSTSGQKGNLGLAATTTAAPTYVTGQSNPLSLNTAGGLRVDGSGVTQPVSGTITANLGTIGGIATETTLSALNTKVPANLTVTSTRLLVDGSGVTQPISVASLPLPTGASTSALQSTGNSSLSSIDGKIPASLTVTATRLLVDGSGVTQPVNNTQINGVAILAGNGVTGTGSQRVTIASDQTAFGVNAIQSGTWNVTNISGTVSLPTGASTAAKQPSLGTAGSASADVLTVQGIASMTPLRVDGSSVTQPVSGTITANIGTTNGLALDATLTGGTQKAIARGGAKGSTIAADLTGTASGVNHQALDVIIYDTSGNAITSFGGGTQYADGGTAATPTGNQMNWNQGGTQRAVSLTQALPIQAGTGVTIPISAASLPLPSSAATGVSQGSTTSGQAGTLAQGAVTTAAPTYTTAQTSPLSLTTAGALRVDNSAVTQPVSISSLPALATGTNLVGGVYLRDITGVEATIFDLTNSNPISVGIVDGSGNQITSFGGGTQYTNGAAQATPTGTTSLGWDGANVRALATDNTGKLNLNNISGTISLPTGAATSALQTTGNSSLSSIDGKTPALGQALAAASVPVILTAAQVSTLTPLSSVGISGTLPAFASTPTVNIGTAPTIAVTGTFWQATQPISASSLPLPTGASTSAKQPNFGIAGTPSIDILSVQGTASMTPLLVDNSGVVQPVSGTVTVNAGTNLNTSTLAVESGGNLASIKTNTDNLNLNQASATSGQRGNLGLAAVTTGAPTYTTGQSNPLSLTTAGALRVDNSAVTQPVSGTITANAGTGNFTVVNGGTFATQATQSGTWNITNVSGTVSLPTGASTAAKQPALGVAGTPSADVLTVQGATSMTALKVDGSAVTQPVSGNITGQAVVTTAAPSYTNATTNALSLTTAGALRVDGSAVTQPTTLTNGATTATVFDLANSNPLSVGIVDGSGNQITSFGGGTQYADGAARGSATGTLMLGDDGTNVQSVSTDSSGRLNVNIVSGAGSGGTSQTDLAAFTAATTSFTPIGGQMDDATPSVLTEGTTGAVRSTANRALHVNLRNASGAEIITPTALGQTDAASSFAVAQANEQVQDLFIIGQGSQTALGNNIILASAGIGATNTIPSGSASYRSVYFHIVPASGTVTAGAITFEGSNDNFVSTANPLLLYDSASQTANPVSTFTLAASTPRYFEGSIKYRHVRARISTGVTGTTTGVQCFTRLNITPYIPLVHTVAQATLASLNATANISQWGGQAVVTGGVNGVLSAGGNIAIGTARTANPLGTGGVDINNLTRQRLHTTQGMVATAGAGEFIGQFSVGSGNAVVTDGTNGKTFHILPRESDVYLDISSISTTPTIQLEGSFDNVNFSVLPLSRIENTAASQQYTAQAAFTPVAGTVWRGKSYGFPILRVHLTAGTASNTVGTLRVVPREDVSGQLSSFFTLNAANTTEAVGTANGAIQAGGVKTLAVTGVNRSKAILQLEAVTGTLTYTLEGSDGNGTWVAISMQPIAGGATVTSVAATGTTALPQTGLFEADCLSYKFVRIRCTAFTSGIAIGSLKIVPINKSGAGYLGTSTLTRAANQTPYTANDVYGGALTIANAGNPFETIFITDLKILFNITAVPSGMANMTLYLYNVTPPSAIADNGVFSVASGDRASLLTPTGIILTPALAVGGGTVVAEVNRLNLQVQLGASTSLFGYLVTSGAFTPAANSETATIQLLSMPTT